MLQFAHSDFHFTVISKTRIDILHPLNPSETSFVNKFKSPIHILIPPIVLLRRTRTKMYFCYLCEEFLKYERFDYNKLTDLWRRSHPYEEKEQFITMNILQYHVTVDLALIREADCSSLPKTNLSKITFMVTNYHCYESGRSIIRRSTFKNMHDAMYKTKTMKIVGGQTVVSLRSQTLAYSSRNLLWHSLNQQNKERETEDNGILWKGRLS